MGTDQELLNLVHEIGSKLAGRDPVTVNRVLDALKTFYPAKLVAKPSSNGVRYME